jgi:hypothetical protein
MIVRDHLGIICQHSHDNPAFMDGGDSAARTGIMALDGAPDSTLLYAFVDEFNKLVRHPEQPNWNDHRNTSRDQLVQYSVSMAWSPMIKKYADGWFINKDFLSPLVRFYLYKCSGYKAPKWIELLAKIEMFFSLIWNTKIKPNDEMNQFACVCIKLGYAKELIEMHPNIFKNIREYWGGWRDQIEVGEVLIKSLLYKAKN